MSPGLPACLLNDTRVDQHHGCQRVMLGLHELMHKSGFEIIGAAAAHSDWTRDAGFLKALERCRLVVVNGEGTIHHDRPAGRKLLEVGAWARSRGIPAVLLNAGWEANSAATAELAKSFTLVAARDTDSARALTASGVACRVVPDLSLYQGAWAAQEPCRKDRVLFTDSVDRWKALALDEARTQCGAELLSIVYPSPGVGGYLRFVRAAIAKADLRYPAKAVRLARVRHRLYQVAQADTAAFMNRLASASLLVSGRFHACTLALCTGTPFVALPSNTGKIAALIRDAGLDAWRHQYPLEPQAVQDAVIRGWSAAEREAVADYLARARREAEQLFSDIQGLV